MAIMDKLHELVSYASCCHSNANSYDDNDHHQSDEHSLDTMNSNTSYPSATAANQLQQQEQSQTSPQKTSPIDLFGGSTLNLYSWNSPESIVLKHGDRLPDFSQCGCRPELLLKSYFEGVPTVELIPNSSSCRMKDIQAAIDQVSKMDLRDNEIRGIVHLSKGEYHVSGTGLKIRSSGVVISGDVHSSGTPTTKLVCTSTSLLNDPLFQFVGTAPARQDAKRNRIAILGDRVPVGQVRFQLADTKNLKVGDTIRVVRNGNDEWIKDIGMHDIPKRPNAPESATKNWKPFNLEFDRVVTVVDRERNTIKIDVGLTTAVESRYGGGFVYKVHSDLLRNCGVENLLVDCPLQSPEFTHNIKIKTNVCVTDNHVERVLSFDNAEQCWAKNITCKHFGHHSWIMRGAKHITIDNCHFLAPAAKLNGGDRYGFLFSGQLSLVQNCSSEQARHAFAVDARVCGPNVFLRNTSTQDLGCSETHHRWASGILYDQCTANIAIEDRAWMGSGQGISGANCVVWNCKGPVIVQNPPTAWNICVANRQECHVAKAAFPKHKSMQDDCYVWLSPGQAPDSLFDHLRKIASSS